MSAKSPPDQSFSRKSSTKSLPQNERQLADELDYITVAPPEKTDTHRLTRQVDKASRILGKAHTKSMEPIPASNRSSILSTRSVPNTPTQHIPTLPLTSLYLVSGLPKSPHTWTLADPDAVLGLHHSEGAVARWWRPEVLGSTVSPGAGGGKKKKKNAKGEPTEVLKGAGALSKAEVGKMLSKALKVCLSPSLLFLLSPPSDSCPLRARSRSSPPPFSPPAPYTPSPLPSPLPLLPLHPPPLTLASSEAPSSPQIALQQHPLLPIPTQTTLLPTPALPPPISAPHPYWPRPHSNLLPSTRSRQPQPSVEVEPSPTTVSVSPSGAMQTRRGVPPSVEHSKQVVSERRAPSPWSLRVSRFSALPSVIIQQTPPGSQAVASVNAVHVAPGPERMARPTAKVQKRTPAL